MLFHYEVCFYSTKVARDKLRGFTECSKSLPSWCPAGPTLKVRCWLLVQALFDLAIMRENRTTDSQVKDLLANGADPSACCYTITPLAKPFPGCAVLHATATSNNSIVASALVKAGADMTARCGEGRTPLHWTPNLNATKIATILVGGGAPLKARNDYRDMPLHETARNQANAIVELLIEAGAEVDAKRENDWRPLHNAASTGAVLVVGMLLEAGADVEARTIDGFTPLHVASVFGQLEAAKLLVEAGADISAEDEYGETPADYICIQNFACDVVNALGDLLG